MLTRWLAACLLLGALAACDSRDLPRPDPDRERPGIVPEWTPTPSPSRVPR
jgi:hypothetical protein